MKSPCYYCSTHTQECHASCAAYREWAEGVKRASEAERKDREAAGYAQDNRERWRRRRNLK